MDFKLLHVLTIYKDLDFIKNTLQEKITIT